MSKPVFVKVEPENFDSDSTIKFDTRSFSVEMDEAMALARRALVKW